VYGAVFGYMASEIGAAMVPTLLLCKRLTGVSLNWAPAFKALLASGLGIGVCYISGLTGTLSGGLLAGAVYILAAFRFGVISMERLRGLKAGIKDRYKAGRSADGGRPLTAEGE